MPTSRTLTSLAGTTGPSFDDLTPRRRAIIVLILGVLWTLGSFATDL